MVNCSKCGAPAEEGARFCGNCGSEFVASSASSAPVAPAQPPPYAQPQYTAMPAKTQGQSTYAVLSLVLGIAGLFACGPFTSIPGIFLGKKELNAIKSGTSSPENEGLAKAGFIISLIVTGLWIVAVLGTIAMIVLGIGLSSIQQYLH
ncbi:MAG: hypothetical protein C5B54_06785 [Acidobacteria bacterium]|nr:MAG: hypothetical protein C5B54_06785 [Acidobacteriota bacterium]